jgi:quercetin dioxygenase-like cupin family protein
MRHLMKPRSTITERRWSRSCIVALAALGAFVLSGGRGEAQEATIKAEAGGRAGPVFSEALPNVPGKRLTAVVVDYAPGGVSAPHRHAGSVFVYVLAGAVRAKVSDDGPVTVYKAGQTFFEPPGSHHLVSENASATEPARILAVFVADEGATLTTYDH